MIIAFCVFVILCFLNVNMVLSLQTTKSCAEFAFVPMATFNKNLYAGDWFMYKIYDFQGSQDVNCFVQVKTPNLDGNHNITAILIKPGDPMVRTDGVAVYDSEGKGQYMYTSQNPPGYNGLYIILETDYSAYYIEVSCIDITGGSIVQLYVGSRSSYVLPATQKAIDETLARYEFDQNAIRTLSITSCPSELLGSDDILKYLLRLLLSG